MKFPENPEYQERIRTATSPASAKSLGRSRAYPIRSDWPSYRDTVMRIALREKFSERHPELKDLLLKTGDRILQEASPRDYYWGIGASGSGQNKLGIMLMELRDELRGGGAATAP